VRCGALDGLGPSRPAMLWEVALARANDASGPTLGGRGAFSESALPAYQVLSARASRGTSGGTSGRAAFPPPAMPEYDARRKLALDLEILDLTVPAHPLALFADRVARLREKRPTVRSIDLAAHVGETVYTVGWYVTGKLTTAQTKSARAARGTSGQEKKELMEFVTLSDEWGKFEVTLFPKAFQRLGLELRRGKGPFLIRGRVELEMGIPGLVAMDIALV